MADITRIIIPMAGLKKVSGFSFEEVLQAAAKEGISCRVGMNHGLTDRRYSQRLYFRDSVIHVFDAQSSVNLYCSKLLRGNYWQDRDRVIRGNAFWIRGYYQILPEFDISQLDGLIAFRQGMLVERTEIRQVHQANRC